MRAPLRRSGRPKVEPAYLSLGAAELRSRAERALRALTRCTVCARACQVDRSAGPAGACRTGRRARVSSFFPHHYEERPISGWRGSGTIFFSGCNLSCVFCQNYEISQGDEGVEVDDEELAEMMLSLQRLGCHNVNLVSPSHVVPQVLSALAIAVPAGLRLPIVYNTGGYDSLATLRLLDGVVDVYMPDAKYDDARTAEQLSGIRHYPRINRLGLREMHRQVGDLQLDEDGIAVRGLLVRHLVLPGGLAGTAGVVEFIASQLSRDTYLNVMAQYHPSYQADRFESLRRRIDADEYAEAIRAARSAGLWRGLAEG